MLQQINIKWKNLSCEVKASIIFMVVSFLNEGVRFITTPIYTRLLSSEQYGVTSVYYSWESILGVVAMLSLQYGIFNNGMYEFRKDRNTYISSILLLSNLSTATVFAIIFFLQGIGLNLINLNMSLLWLMMLVFMVKPAYSFWVSQQRYEFKYKKPAIFSLILAVSSPIAGIFLLLHAETNKAIVKLWGSYIPNIIIWFGFYCFIWDTNKV